MSSKPNQSLYYFIIFLLPHIDSHIDSGLCIDNYQLPGNITTIEQDVVKEMYFTGICKTKSMLHMR